MFRDKHAERMGVMQGQIDLVENTLMMNLPRMHRMEKLITDITKRVDSMDSSMDMLTKRSKLRDEQPESPEASLASAAATVVTAGLAASAPLYKELTLPGPSQPPGIQPPTGPGQRYGPCYCGRTLGHSQRADPS